MLPSAITPFAARGRIVMGSIPMQMCTSGHDPIDAVDLYSHPNITGPRSIHSRHMSRGVSRPTQLRQIAFWQIAQMPTAARVVCVEQSIDQFAAFKMRSITF
jgi:hypothetical protein